MGKFIGILALVALVLVYFDKAAPNFQVTSKVNKVSERQVEQTDKIRELDALAKSALLAAERYDNDEMNVYIQKMVDKGVLEFTQPAVYQKQTPNCPPVKIELNGKTLSGSLCAKFGYKYNNKMHWVGYCK